jgi:hypothetical protein
LGGVPEYCEGFEKWFEVSILEVADAILIMWTELTEVSAVGHN